jgi:hypothetical protein
MGENIGKALSNGLNSGLWGGAIGGLSGGITGGIRAGRNGNNFWSGNAAGGKYGNVPQVDVGRMNYGSNSHSINRGGLNKMNPVSVDGYVPSTWDEITNQRISELHPKLRSTAARFINRAESELGINLRIAQGFRTMAEQDALFAQGRTIAGNIVTNVSGCYSYHNYGLAFDVVGMSNGAINYNLNWTSIGNLGVSMGLEWGGNFSSFIDRPHFQMTFGHSIEELLNINF